ncbi:MAG: SPOR domain-containing protein, partial [Hyphomicrobiaceae bacterium]
VKVGGAERPPVKAADETAPPPKATDAPAQGDSPPGGGDNQGPRAVKTITIKPGSGAPAPVIPGITLYTPPEASAPPQPSAKEETKEVQPPPSRVTFGTPPPAPPPAENDPPVAPPPVSKKAPVQAALAVPRAPSPPKARETPSGSGLGFVAVLKSAKTHMEAMTSFADLQQKYPEVLSDRSFDVQEADLSARGLGTMYRVVVGPPGSHNAASGVCVQLKAAGYVGCWVKEY